jgi:hypothetical protein
MNLRSKGMTLNSHLDAPALSGIQNRIANGQGGSY